MSESPKRQRLQSSAVPAAPLSTQPLDPRTGSMANCPAIDHLFLVSTCGIKSIYLFAPMSSLRVSNALRASTSLSASARCRASFPRHCSFPLNLRGGEAIASASALNGAIVSQRAFSGSSFQRVRESSSTLSSSPRARPFFSASASHIIVLCIFTITHFGEFELP